MKILRPEEITEWPATRELTPEELAQAYALARAAFTAEDLQRYTEVGPEIPADEVLAELEEDQRKYDAESKG
jgi:hypothetical protein